MTYRPAGSWQLAAGQHDAGTSTTKSRSCTAEIGSFQPPLTNSVYRSLFHTTNERIQLPTEVTSQATFSTPLLHFPGLYASLYMCCTNCLHRLRPLSKRRRFPSCNQSGYGIVLPLWSPCATARCRRKGLELAGGSRCYSPDHFLASPLTATTAYSLISFRTALTADLLTQPHHEVFTARHGFDTAVFAAPCGVVMQPLPASTVKQCWPRQEISLRRACASSAVCIRPRFGQLRRKKRVCIDNRWKGLCHNQLVAH